MTSQILQRLRRTHASAATSLAVLAFVIAAAISWVQPPTASLHDEFSKLLAADTFAEGRLTNPSHPMWEHFESFHIIQQPSYASKYPPGPGAVLAFGQVVFGRPIVGVWCVTALATAAFYWMLLAFVPRRWAFNGGLLFALHPNLQVYLGQCFFVENLALLGGILVVGAVPRLANSVSISSSALMATGAILLAASRPYEGLMLCILCGCCVVVAWVRKTPPSASQLNFRTILPFSFLMAAGLSLLGWVNYEVTGSPTRMAYQIHEETYGICPLFVWQSPPEHRSYSHPALRAYHADWSMDWFRQQQTFGGFLSTKLDMLSDVYFFYVPLPVLFLLLAVPLLQSRKLRQPIVLIAMMLCVSAVAVFANPRYLAPTAPLILLLFVQAVRYLHVLARRRLPSIQPVAVVALLLTLKLGLETAHVRSEADQNFGAMRQRITQQLCDRPGDHLVLVTYGADHTTHEEWVYNRANIDAARVVWARSLGEERDSKLQAYFSDRTVWKLEANGPATALSCLTTQTGAIPLAQPATENRQAATLASATQSMQADESELALSAPKTLP